MRVAQLALLLAVGSVACSQNGESGEGGTAVAQASRPSELPPLKFLRRMPKKGPPEAFTLHPDVVLTAEQFIQHYAPALWGLGPTDELRPEGTREGANGHVNRTYVQIHGGYPVEGAKLILTTRNGRVVSGGGNPLAGLSSLKLDVRVAKEDAIERAHQRMASALGVEKEELNLRRDTVARLVIIATPRRLAWFVMVRAVPIASRNVTLDAATGDVLRDQDVTFMH